MSGAQFPAWLLLVWILPAAAQKTHEFCSACHSAQTADFQDHAHFKAGLSCDACHGRSEKHRAAEGAAPPDRVAAPDEVPALCGGCHSMQQKEFSSSKHGELVLARSKVRAAHCGTCHGVHGLRSSSQMFQQCQRCHAALPSSHPQASPTSCWGCHSKHTLKTG